MECLICGIKLTKRGIGSHLKGAHGINAKIYYDCYLKVDNEGICPICGKETTFLGITRGYLKYCSNKCSNNSGQMKEKSRLTNLNRYGVENASQSKVIREKVEQTNLKKYGKKHPLQVKKFQLKAIQTTKERYGVDYAIQSDEVKMKIQETNLQKYGVKNVMKSPSIVGKLQQSVLEKYGVSHPNQRLENKEKISNSHYKRMFHRLLNSNRLKERVKPLFDVEDYNGSKGNYEWECLKCGNIFTDTIVNGKIPRCMKCYPTIKCSSSYEDEISEWLNSLGIEHETGNRTIIQPFELDIVLSDYNLAIEFNGLYYHSELNGKDKYYHINKTNLCKEKGIQLLHIFEDEWINKQDIVKSIIKSKLGLFDKKVGARECVIKEVSNSDAEMFLEENHIQGSVNSKEQYGLYYDNELVVLATFGKNRFRKSDEWELLRFCSKKCWQIHGGLGKLLSEWECISSDKYKLISYSDKRLFDGFSYIKYGFKIVEESEPNYYYMNKYKFRENRIKYQKHKLSKLLNIYDDKLTEWENMQLNGFDRIWDCGNNVFQLNK